MKSNLNLIEVYTCILSWMFINVFVLFKLYQSQTDLQYKYPHHFNDLIDLQAGWRVLARLRDTSDVEWSSFKYFFQISWQYLTVQFFITEIIRRTSVQYLKQWYIISSIMYVIIHFGYKQLLLVILQPLLYATIIFAGGKKWSIWITSIALLCTYNSVKYRTFFWAFLDYEKMHDEEVYLILYCMPWIELRCISYCLDYIDRCEEKPDRSVLQSLVDMMSYCLYVPLLYMGPVVLNDEFEKSFSMPNKSLGPKLARFMKEMCIYLFYTFLLDLALHYIYFYAMHDDIQLVRMLPFLALCGGGLWMGLQFHMKYVVGYGTTSAFSKLDNVDTPPTPRCIARIHVYSHMWKYFDVGLYRFLVKYVYRPCFDVVSRKHNLPKILNKMVASFVTFSFVFMWHGSIKRIFIWSLLNYLGITLEYLGKELKESDKYKWFKKNVLITDSMETRFVAVLTVPVLSLSAISNFYLFADTKIGDVYVESLKHFSLTDMNTLIVFIALYCCCITSMALQDVPSRTDVKNAIKVVD